MFTAFCEYNRDRLEKECSKKETFIRNDKSDTTIHQKGIDKNTRELYRGTNKRTKPTDDGYEVLQRNYLEQLNHDRKYHLQLTFSKLQTEKEKWNFIYDIRNIKRTKTEIETLQNLFGDIIEDQKQISNLLNYRFSRLGNNWRKSPVNEKSLEKLFNDEVFNFQPISLFTCKKC